MPHNNGTLELIEVIRSQELEIHKQKKYNEKQYKQLAQQAQVSDIFFFLVLFSKSPDS